MTSDSSIEEQLPAALRALRADPPSGFTDRVLGRLGLLGETDEYVRAQGPLGHLFVAFNETGVCHVLNVESVGDDPAEFAAWHRRRFGRAVRPGRRVTGLVTALRTGRARSLDYDLRGLSPFQQSALRATFRIPRGEIRSYGWVAREIGEPNAVTAVTETLTQNPVPVLVPCHRVVRDDGRLGDHALGGGTKRELLLAEGVLPEELTLLARTGFHYLGSDTTNIYCFPTCHNARRITKPHQVPFQSTTDAAAAGYRPCKQCRPAEAFPA